jgi:lactoylglutathione lyase
MSKPSTTTDRRIQMRTLHLGLRVTDLERSLAFYAALGYEIVGEVPETGLGHLTMLKLPGDEFVTIEVVHDPDGAPVDDESRLSHFVIQVDDMAATFAQLAERGIDAEAPTSPDGSDDFRTTWIVDPDGNRIEFVQWPAGHAVGMTAADFVEPQCTDP